MSETSLLSALLASCLPGGWEQLVELGSPAPIVGMHGEPVEDVGEVGVGVDAIELAGLDDAVDRGGVAGGSVASSEQVIAAADGDAAELALGEVVVGRQARIVDEAGQRSPVAATIGDGLAERRTWEQLLSL